jgi:hypothetical protein
MFFNLILILITVMLYCYRRVVFLKALSLILWIYKWRIECRLKKIKPIQNQITHQTSTTINDSCFTEYDVIFNEKEYNFVMFSDFDVLEFEKSIGNNIDKRNLIVHSSITNDMGEILFDITSDLRKFSFYFDKHVKLNMFFDFLDDKKIKKRVNITDYNIMLYMNDDNFTEKVYKIKEIYNTNFVTIFFDNFQDEKVPLQLNAIGEKVLLLKDID